MKPGRQKSCPLPTAGVIRCGAEPPKVDVFGRPVADPEADIPALQKALTALEYSQQ